ncbi:DUF1080 domain-containing protein [Blastopirellula marina]|uniref:DUF1080 domain-containing protein n=1 Tax=Blastopirellula marina TaxID=124 RepID=A0A2S8GC09_9BACT|nr:MULTISPECIES: DUF1080 domain-containing protein [Pirellulaceae]PQO41840.1 DUF1080 domain-containing protein [Blastopirellula marina]RCS56392.1 DUF1080 domain-containing protein [Bremerella cremea]
MRTATIAFGLALILIASTTLSAEEAKEKAKAKPLFDGKTLENFEVPQFGGDGEVEVKDGVISMGQGAMLTGITYKRDDFPKTNYELTWEARRTMGIDFFAAATFPVKDSHCSFIPGGWGGAVVGLSNIDGEDASENETTTYIAFKDDQWYQFKVRVTDKKIEAWIDDKQVVDANIEGKKISTRNEVDLSHPMGIAAWQSAAEIRKIELRELGK